MKLPEELGSWFVFVFSSCFRKQTQLACINRKTLSLAFLGEVHNWVQGEWENFVVYLFCFSILCVLAFFFHLFVPFCLHIAGAQKRAYFYIKFVDASHRIHLAWHVTNSPQNRRTAQISFCMPARQRQSETSETINNWYFIIVFLNTAGQEASLAGGNQLKRIPLTVVHSPTSTTHHPIFPLLFSVVYVCVCVRPLWTMLKQKRLVKQKPKAKPVSKNVELAQIENI